VSEPVAAAVAPKASLWEDFIDIFTSPSQVFRRRENSPFGMQLLVLAIAFAILLFGTKSLVQPVFDAEMSRQTAQLLKAHPEVPAEAVQKQMAIGAKVAPYIIVIAIPITAILTGLVLWMVGKLFDSKQTANSAIMVATYSFFPKLLALIVGAVIAALSSADRLTGPGRISVGLGALLDPDTTSPVLLALLLRVDVFTIWTTILLAIGLQVTGKVSKTNSYIAAAIVWLIGALPAVLGALRR
jgi:hypothetical protein